MPVRLRPADRTRQTTFIITGRSHLVKYEQIGKVSAFSSKFDAA